MVSNRTSVLCSMIKKDFIGCELGVAKGIFSYQLLKYSNIKYLYSIDMWAGDRGHNESEKLCAQKLLSEYSDRNLIIHKKFEDAIDLFPNHFFNFIYIDGYAHTGQDNGKTLYDWWDKLKVGGVFSGHDYDKSWPLTVHGVNEFIETKKHLLNIIPDKPYNSWYIIKEN